jgi:hypothetical protein
MNRRMTMVLVLGGAFFLPTECFGQSKFAQAEYLRGAASGQKKGEAVKGALTFDGAKKEVVFFDSKNTTVLNIPYASLKSMLYEKTATPRYTAAVLISPFFLFSKAKRHYLTFQYTDASGTGQYAVIHLDKSNARDALAAAEAETGKKIERIEER